MHLEAELRCGFSSVVQANFLPLVGGQRAKFHSDFSRLCYVLDSFVFISQLAETKFFQSFSLFAVLLEGILWPIHLPYGVPQNPGACSQFRRYIYS
jgi:hypothetical protein